MLDSKESTLDSQFFKRNFGSSWLLARATVTLWNQLSRREGWGGFF